MRLTARLDLSALSSLAARRGPHGEDAGRRDTGDGDEETDARWMKGLPKTSSFRSAGEGMDTPFGPADRFDDE